MILTNKVKIIASNTEGMKVISELEELVVNFILPIVLLVISVGISVFYISPVHKKLPDLESELDSKVQENTILQAKVEQLTALQQDKELVLSDLVKMSWALEERDKVPELTQQVRLMSADSKVNFVSLVYDNANKGESVVQVMPEASLTPDPQLYRDEKINISINFDGNNSIVDFLRATETSIRLLRVESLQISTINQENKANLIMTSPYLNPVFSTYSETAAPISLTDSAYRGFMGNLDNFRNYAKEIDSTLPKI